MLRERERVLPGISTVPIWTTHTESCYTQGSSHTDIVHECVCTQTARERERERERVINPR